MRVSRLFTNQLANVLGGQWLSVLNAAGELHERDPASAILLGGGRALRLRQTADEIA
jgi:hypothetical protein